MGVWGEGRCGIIEAGKGRCNVAARQETHENTGLTMQQDGDCEVVCSLADRHANKVTDAGVVLFRWECLFGSTAKHHAQLKRSCADQKRRGTTRFDHPNS